MIRPRPAFFALLAAVACLAPARADEPLPSDPRMKTGKLANGMTWIYRQHDVPPGKMALMMHVGSGSLSETEEQRGLAHFIEHMAFNGSENFPPGQLIPYFESIGMQFGDDLNAFTSFDQTAYMLFLPDTTTEQVDKALMVLSDYAFRLLLTPEEIDKERGVVLEELRAGKGAQQRLRDQLFEKLFVDSRLGKRLPIGLEKVIQGAQRPAFDAFYRTWYRPEHITLLLVGDAAPEPYLPLIEKRFGQYKPTAEAKPDQGSELKPFTKERAIVLSDPEYDQGDVDIYNVSPGRPPTTTLEQSRVDLTERIGSWIMERRFSERIKKGQASFREASAQVSRFFKDAVLVNASTVGEPKDWEKMLDELTLEVSRVREYGFLDGEFELCKKELLSSAEDNVRKDPTRNAQTILMEMLHRVNEHEPMLSAEQRLDVLAKLLPTIKVDEVNKAFAAHFKPGSFAFVLTMPKREDVKLPSEEDVLAAARAALARKPEAPTWETRPTTLLEKEPTPGKLAESTKDEDLGITSAWLDNGIRLHHRFMDYKKDTVMLSITLAGGQIEETADNAGVTTVAGLIVAQPATGRLRSTDIEDIMTGKNISLGGGAQDDTFTITLSGSPKDLEAGLQLTYALLTDGKLEQSAFDNWKQGALQQYEMDSKRPDYVAFDAFVKTVSGNDPRRAVLQKPDRINAQSLARGQEWFDRLRTQAPVEVAIVGEVQFDDVLPLLEKYIGSLPKHPRAAESLEKLRKLNRPAGPLVSQTEVDTITPLAVALVGFMGCDAGNMPDVRALNIAANILDSRLIKRVREELALVYSIQAVNGPGRAYADSGIFFSGAPCSPDKPEDVIKEVEALFQSFADSGPTPEELENAKKQIFNHLDTQLKEPSFWFNQLENLDLHKTKLADLKNIPEAYEAVTADQVRDVFKKYRVPARQFRVVAVPSKTATEPAAGESKPQTAPATP